MNMGKHVKIFLVTMAVALFGVLAVGCGSSATAVPQAAPKEVFKLKFTSPLPAPPFLISETIKWWADEVAARSDGRIEWTDFYWLGALAKGGETIEALQVGLADAGMTVYPYYPAKLPLGNFTYAVPFGPGDPKMILEATRRLFDEVPALRAETERYNIKFLLPEVIDTYNLTSKSPIVTFEDFKGIKIASIGSYHPKILQAAGAVAIAMPVAERYQALQTGVIEAEFLPWDISYSFKYQDINKHATFVNMGGAMPVGVGLNKDVWNRFPQDLRDLMLQVADEAADRNAALIMERREEAIAGFKEAGVEIHEMSDADRSKWANALDDIPGQWIKEMEEKGLPGEKIMVGYLDILEELGHVFPRKWAADYRD